MNNIIIGFSYPKKFKIGAWLLKIWQKSDYSHTYVRFESDLIESTVYQASHGMVHFQTFENFKKENITIIEFKLICNRYNCLKHCINLAGETYSKLELLKIMLYDIFMNFNIKFNFQDSDGFVCSELVGVIAEKELGLYFKKPAYLLTPKDIYLKICEK